MTGTEKTIEGVLVLPLRPEILGPESEFARRRSALKAEFAEAVEAAKLITKIDTQEQAELATQIGRTLQAGVKEIEIFFKPVKSQIDNFKKPVLEAEKEDANRLTVEKDKLGRLLTTWNQHVQALQREEERKAREAAEKAAQEAQIAMAIELHDSGDLEQAAEVLEQAPYIPPVIVQAAAAPKMAGTVAKTVYTARVEGWLDKGQMEQPETHPGWVNFRILVKAVAEGRAPLRAILPNESFISKQGSDYKEGFSMPGCKLDKKAGTSFRA